MGLGRFVGSKLDVVFLGRLSDDILRLNYDIA